MPLLGLIFQFKECQLSTWHALLIRTSPNWQVAFIFTGQADAFTPFFRLTSFSQTLIVQFNAVEESVWWAFIGIT